MSCTLIDKRNRLKVKQENNGPITSICNKYTWKKKVCISNKDKKNIKKNLHTINKCIQNLNSKITFQRCKRKKFYILEKYFGLSNTMQIHKWRVYISFHPLFLNITSYTMASNRLELYKRMHTCCIVDLDGTQVITSITSRFNSRRMINNRQIEGGKQTRRTTEEIEVQTDVSKLQGK